MIDAARELESGRNTYRVADVENLSFLDDGSFDNCRLVSKPMRFARLQSE